MLAMVCVGYERLQPSLTLVVGDGSHFLHFLQAMKAITCVAFLWAIKLPPALLVGDDLR